MNIEKIKAAALAVCSWKLGTAWLDASEDESAAVVGHIDEDGNEYAVITVDCDQYFQGQDSLPLAKYYAQANPSAVLELIERLEAAERDAERYRFIKDEPWCSNVADVICHHQNAAWDVVIDAAMKEKP